MGDGQNDGARVNDDVEQAERVAPQRPLADGPTGHRGPDRRHVRRLRDQRDGRRYGGVKPERSLLAPLKVPSPFPE